MCLFTIWKLSLATEIKFQEAEISVWFAKDFQKYPLLGSKIAEANRYICFV